MAIESMDAQIRDVIDNQLPTQVGTILKSRLLKADEDAMKVKHLENLLETVRAERESALAKLKAHESMDMKIKDLESLQRDVEKKLLRNDLNELKVAEAIVRVNDMKSVVGMVFQNNRFKYQESMYGQAVGEPGSYTHPISSGRTVESEG